MSFHTSAPEIMAHLTQGYHEAIDEAYGPLQRTEARELEATFPAGTGVKRPCPDLGALELANAMVAVERGYVGEADADLLPKPPPKVREAVNLPDHYARFDIEPIHFIGTNRLGFLPGNVIKYVMRWDAKDGIQDLYKAKRYLEMMIAFVEGDPDWWKAKR